MFTTAQDDRGRVCRQFGMSDDDDGRHTPNWTIAILAAAGMLLALAFFLYALAGNLN